MPENLDESLVGSNPKEVQEVIEHADLDNKKLKEQIQVTSWTKKEIKRWFSWFFERLKNVWGEIKEWHLLNAINILIWRKKQVSDSQQVVENTTSSVDTSNEWSDNPISTSDELVDQAGKQVDNKVVDQTTEGDVDNSKDNKIDDKEKEPKDTDLVSVKEYIPSIILDMRYATKNNFTWEKIYDDVDAKLRYWTIKKLKVAQDSLQKQWYSLKIWDAFRSEAAQAKMREVVKDWKLVAQWKSDHNRGLDVTLVKADWTEIPMPSKFDDFDNKAACKSDFSSVSWEKKKNWKILQDAMVAAKFCTYDNERWHFYDEDKERYSYMW